MNENRESRLIERVKGNLSRGSETMSLKAEDISELSELFDEVLNLRMIVGPLKGMPEAEILRRWKIVDAMIEELDEEKADREDTMAQLKKEVDRGNFFWSEVMGKVLTENNEKISQLEKWLGLEEGDG